MRQIVNHPVRTLGVVLATAFVLFNVAGIPALRYADHGLLLAVADVLWFVLLTTAALFVVLALVFSVRGLLVHRRTS